MNSIVATQPAPILHTESRPIQRQRGGIRHWQSFILLWLLPCLLGLATTWGASTHAVVVSNYTQQETDWAQVVEALVEKHHGPVLVYETA